MSSLDAWVILAGIQLSYGVVTEYSTLRCRVNISILITVLSVQFNFRDENHIAINVISGWSYIHTRLNVQERSIAYFISCFIGALRRSLTASRLQPTPHLDNSRQTFPQQPLSTASFLC